MQDVGPNIPATPTPEAGAAGEVISSTSANATARTAAAKGQYLFADDTIASFFR
jgi:hypothetical protein